MTGPTKAATAAANEVGKGDPRYASLHAKRFNKRFQSEPDAYRVVSCAQDVVEALRYALSRDLRVSVQSGGHCLEGLVSDPAVRLVIDTSLLTSISYDERMRAFVVEAGATLGELYRKLFLGWGVTLPAGQSPDIGVGGHVLGGGFGFLHRQHGLAADHLYGVELVHVDSAGNPQVVTATRDAQDPNRELWWAHTGCGGGNLGIVTRYYLRSPGALGDDPRQLLPRAPNQVTTFSATWDWERVDERVFGCLLRNYGQWCEQNSAPDSPTNQLFSVLTTGRSASGTLRLRGVVTGDGADTLIDAHLAALESNALPAHDRKRKGLSWLEFALNPLPDLFAVGPGGVVASHALLKVKDALLRRPYTDRQTALAYDYLTRRHPEVGGGSIGLATYGGRINAVAAHATASAQRGSVMTTSYGVAWTKPEDEAPALKWLRDLYQELFAEDGGVPAPGERYQGALINHPDADLADPALNRSGIPWSALYYGANYARLQRVKARWDPRNVFRHALSIR